MGKKLVLGTVLVLAIVLIALGVQEKSIWTEVEINASADKVWNILTDLESYQDWNPHIPQARGRIATGNKLYIRVKERDGSEMSFEPTVIKVVPKQEFRWLGRLYVPRLFDGEHIFEIEEVSPRRVRLSHRETFRGVLVLPFWKKLKTETRGGFEAMNAALKRRAEAS